MCHGHLCSTCQQGSVGSMRVRGHVPTQQQVQTSGQQQLLPSMDGLLLMFSAQHQQQLAWSYHQQHLQTQLQQLHQQVWLAQPQHAQGGWSTAAVVVAEGEQQPPLSLQQQVLHRQQQQQQQVMLAQLQHAQFLQNAATLVAAAAGAAATHDTAAAAQDRQPAAAVAAAVSGWESVGAAADALERVEGTKDVQEHACTTAAAGTSTAAARAQVVVTAKALLDVFQKPTLLQRLQAAFLQELKQTPPAQTLAMSAEDSRLVVAALKSCAHSCLKSIEKTTSSINVKGVQSLESTYSRVQLLDELLELAEQHKSVWSGTQSTSAQHYIASCLTSACSRLDSAHKQLQMCADAAEVGQGRTAGDLLGSITKQDIRTSRLQGQQLLKAVALLEDLVERVGGDDAAQRFYAQSLPVSHHTTDLRAKMRFCKGAADRHQAPTPTMQCSCCSQFIHSSHSLVVHECPKGTEVTAAALDVLAAAAGCAARPAGMCFLCDAPVGEGETHTCHSVLWTLLLVDESHLPHANPYSSVRALLQNSMAEFRRRSHGIVHILFLCPSTYLPEQLPAQRLMAQQSTWPIMEYLLVIGPSVLVPGQRRAFALQPLDQQGGEIRPCRVKRGNKVVVTVGLSQGMQDKVVQQHTQQKGTATFKACLTQSLTGFYTGAPRATEVENDDDLACTLIKARSKAWFVDPRDCGSVHVLINLAHDWAAVLEPVHMTFSTHKGTHSHMLLQAVQRSSLSGAQWQLLQAKLPELLQRGGGLLELTWDYQATRDTADDLTSTPCLCVFCDTQDERRTVVTLRE